MNHFVIMKTEVKLEGCFAKAPWQFGLELCKLLSVSLFHGSLNISTPWFQASAAWVSVFFLSGVSPSLFLCLLKSYSSPKANPNIAFPWNLPQSHPAESVTLPLGLPNPFFSPLESLSLQLIDCEQGGKGGGTGPNLCKSNCSVSVIESVHLLRNSILCSSLAQKFLF